MAGSRRFAMALPGRPNNPIQFWKIPRFTCARHSTPTAASGVRTASRPGRPHRCGFRVRSLICRLRNQRCRTLLTRVLQLIGLDPIGLTGRRRLSGVAPMAVFALLLRSLLPMPHGLASAGNADPALLFGEHALCLAAVAADAGEAPRPVSPDNPGHADHDQSDCCLHHAAGMDAVPPPGVPMLIRFTAVRADPVSATVLARRVHHPGGWHARAPPLSA